jgi:hypothetical protein
MSTPTPLRVQLLDGGYQGHTESEETDTMVDLEEISFLDSTDSLTWIMMNNLLDPPEAGPLAQSQHGPLVADDYEDEPQEVIPMEVDLVQLQAQLGNLNNIGRVGGIELVWQMSILRNVQNQQGSALRKWKTFWHV